MCQSVIRLQANGFLEFSDRLFPAVAVALPVVVAAKHDQVVRLGIDGA